MFLLSSQRLWKYMTRKKDIIGYSLQNVSQIQEPKFSYCWRRFDPASTSPMQGFIHPRWCLGNHPSTGWHVVSLAINWAGRICKTISCLDFSLLGASESLKSSVLPRLISWETNVWCFFQFKQKINLGNRKAALSSPWNPWVLGLKEQWNDSLQDLCWRWMVRGGVFSSTLTFVSQNESLLELQNARDQTVFF